MEHFRPKRPADSTGAGQVWTHQGLALNGGDQPTGVLVAGRNAAPEWQARIYRYRYRLASGLFTLDGCSGCQATSALGPGPVFAVA
jgi:hypothetical protein